MIEDQKLVEAMSQGRMINAAENVIYPMLEKKIQERLTQACAKFAGGTTDFISDIAYISGLKDIQNNLKRIQQDGNSAHKTLHEKNKE